MFEPSEFKIAIACGSGGSFVDVSDYILFDEGDVTRSSGLSSPFEDARPGSFAFTLDNSDGRFTPGSTSTPLDLPLQRGMRVCWQLNDRLFEARMSDFSPTFADIANEETARMRVSCLDMLSLPADVRLSGSLSDTIARRNADLYWPLTDPAGGVAVEQSGAQGPAWSGNVFTFGQDGEAGGLRTRALLQTAAGISRVSSLPLGFDAVATWVNFWITPMTATGFVDFKLRNGVRLFAVINGNFVIGNGQTWAFETGRTYFVSSGGSNELWVDGEQVLLGAPPIYPPTVVTSQIIVGDTAGGATSVYLSEFSVSSTRIQGEFTRLSTSEQRITAIATALPEIDIDVAPDVLSGALIGPDTNAQSLLDYLNAIVRTEQGYLSTATTGTLTAPETAIVIRERTRPATVSQSFVTVEDVSGEPTVDLNSTNVASEVINAGPVEAAVARSIDVETAVGVTSRREDTLLLEQVDLTAWAEDRINRGYSPTIEVQSFVVDARGADTDRWADLLELQFGDRVRIEQLPATQYGIAEWDGWLVGLGELHASSRNRFTLRLARAFDEARFDVDRFMADDDELTLSAGITNSATSLSVATTLTKLSTTETPYTIQIDDELLNVTACTSATPQVLTVTRGAEGTTAAAHSAGAAVQIYPDARFAF
ncbi:hypothetical protein [Microcella sp.]|uniref:hypothetical protein n=1 Tax=Microcella sp. TaxID=1913979 RepID=UPI00391A3E24